MSRPLTALSVGVLLLAATPAVADAKNYKGKTSQKRGVSLRTGADGVINKASLRWRAPCGQGYFWHGATGFRPPFDAATPDAFQDEGTYRTRAKNGERSRVTTTFAGQRDPATDRWTGTFAVKVMVSKRGKVIDRCELKRVTWTAK